MRLGIWVLTVWKTSPGTELFQYLLLESAARSRISSPMATPGRGVESEAVEKTPYGRFSMGKGVSFAYSMNDMGGGI